jgi:hypothetical protein
MGGAVLGNAGSSRQWVTSRCQIVSATVAHSVPSKYAVKCIGLASCDPRPQIRYRPAAAGNRSRTSNQPASSTPILPHPGPAIMSLALASVVAQVLAGNGIVGLIIGLIFIGVLLWAVETMIPMDPSIRRLIQVVIILGAIVWVAHAFGVF